MGALPCPDISREEIVNACGLDYEGGHDGVNYVRTACVIAVSKAKQLLEPYIHQVRAVTSVNCGGIGRRMSNLD